MRPDFQNTLAIVKLRQKLCFYQGKLFGIRELRDMVSERLSENKEAIYKITSDVESMSGYYNMIIYDIENEIEELQEGELS